MSMRHFAYLTSARASASEVDKPVKPDGAASRRGGFARLGSCGRRAIRSASARFLCPFWHSSLSAGCYAALAPAVGGRLRAWQKLQLGRGGCFRPTALAERKIAFYDAATRSSWIFSSDQGYLLAAF